MFATRLLERFANHNPALIGDLMEEYETGRSPFWYWRQVLTAIVVGSFGSIRAHKWLALRALVIGWVFLEAASRLAFPFTRDSLMWLLERGMVPRHMLFTYVFPLSTLLLIFIISVSGGWVVASTHRPYSTAMVLLLLASVMMRMAPTLPWFFRLLRDTFDNSRYIPAFLMLLSNYLVVIVGWLLGGMLGSESLSHSDGQPKTVARQV